MSEDQRPPDDSTGTDGRSAPDAAREGVQKQFDSVPGKRLGDFELLRELGRGGMGIVYEARQVSLNRCVALKILPPGLGLSEQAIQRFEREARAAAKLHHTNIVPVYYIGAEEGCHFYAMELVEGSSLTQILEDVQQEETQTAREETLTRLFNPAAEDATAAKESPRTTSKTAASQLGRSWFDTVARQLSDVAEALEHAHSRGVIHRDIKPANLLLSPEGRLCITDFGLARIAHEPGMTATGAFLGTPAYMCPEQARGKSVDHRADVYSLGVVLYEMLTLRRPFSGDSWEKVVHALLTQEPTGPRQVNPRIPLDLETICQKAMEKDPDRRYQSAAAFANDLRRYLQGGLITARRAGPVRRLGKLIGRHPVASTAVAATVLLVALGVVAWRATATGSIERARRSLADARFAMSQGIYDEALASVEQTLAIHRDEEARVLRAKLLMKLGRMQEAVDEARSVLQNNPDDWIAHLILATAANDRSLEDSLLGSFAGKSLESFEGGSLGASAEEHVQAVVSLAPDTGDAYYLRAKVTELAADKLPLLDRALELDPSHAEALADRLEASLRLQRFHPALLDAERLTAARPRSAQGRRLIATVCWRKKDLERGFEEIERAIELDPDDAENYMLRSYLHENRVDIDRRIADLDHAIRLRPGWAPYYVARAHALTFLNDRYDAARADVARAVELKPDYLWPHSWLIELHLRQGEPQAAREVIARLEVLAADSADVKTRATAHRYISNALRQLGDAQAALAAAELAVEYAPQDWPSYVERALVRRAVRDEVGFEEDCAVAGQIKLHEPGEFIERAEALGRDCRRKDLAIRDYERVVEMAPDWWGSYFWRAYRGHIGQTLAEKVADFTKAIELAPQWGALYDNRGATLVEMGRYDDAIADFEKCLEVGFPEWITVVNRGQALWELNRRNEALADFDRLIELRPSWAVGYLYRCNLRDQLGRHEAALSDIDKAVELDPRNDFYHRRRSFILFRDGRVEEALAAAEQAVEIGPSNAWNLMGRASISVFMSGSCDDVKADQDKAWELSNGDARIGHRLAWQLAAYGHKSCPETHDPERAIKLAEKAVDSDPRNAEFLSTLGLARYRNREFQRARETMLKTLELRTDEIASDHFTICMILWKMGDKGGARTHCDRAVSRMSETWPKDPSLILLREEASRLLGNQPR